MEITLLFLLSYFSGSIPFGLILTKIFTGQDIRTKGSGNIGATNVLRTGKRYLAFFTLLLDISKGYIPVIIAKEYFPDLVNLAALLAFLGHVFPIWLKFKGGKGVATYLGILLALSHALALLFVLTWVTITLIFKYSSLSSIFATLSVFVISFLKENVINSIGQSTNNPNNLKFILFVFLILIIYTHRKNISNLVKKSEKKIKL